MFSNNKIAVFLLAIFSLAPLLLRGQVQLFTEQPLFQNGTAGYSCFRIPAIIRAPNGDLLAFAEGRVAGCSDFGNVDIVLRRSKDNGKTWGELELVVDNGSIQAGNPAPLVDLMDTRYTDGRIFLFYNTGNRSESEIRKGRGIREIWYITSIDNGRTWSDRVNITESVHRPNQPEINPAYNFPEDWRSYAITPGHAIQLSKAPFSGRLFIPANHSYGPPQPKFYDYRAHGFYSDDHGKTWKLGSSVDLPSSNEAMAVELSDGKLMMNIREQSGENRSRIVAISSDGGESWDTAFVDKNLPSPVCQASILSLQPFYQEPILLFANPASQTNREAMTVRLSIDNGKNWIIERVVRPGASAYSDMVIQQDTIVGLLYEHGNDGGIHYARFNLDWIKEGTQNTSLSLVRSKEINYSERLMPFSLAPPLIQFSSNFFQEEQEATLYLDLQGVDIFYTTNGELPDSSSRKVTGPITIEKDVTLTARAFHRDYQPSEPVQVRFFKTGDPIPTDDAKLKLLPSEKYPGNGANSLLDHKKGSGNFNDGNWLGFEGKDLELEIDLKGKALKEVIVSYLSDHSSWIFEPVKVEVWSINKKGSDTLLSEKSLARPDKRAPSDFKFLQLPISPDPYEKVRIIVTNQGRIPEWHEGAGTPAWLFVDEIIFR